MTVVVLRAIGLGDFLTGVPAYRGLRRHFADQEIVLAAPAPLAGLARLTGAVDRLLPTPDLRPLDWAGPPPEVAVDLHGRGPASQRLLDRLTPARRIGHQAPGWPGPPWPERLHEVRRWVDLLHWHGIRADPADLRLPPPGSASPAPGAVVLHPGAAFPARRWPADRFAAVARALEGEGERVVVTGSAAERPLAAAVAVGAGLAADAVLAGRLDLLELAALVAGARLVLSGDTGVAHLAGAYGTRSVVLCGPVPPAEWGPPGLADRGQPHRVLWPAPPGYRGDPHGSAVDPVLLQIRPADVLATTRASLVGG